ncbi:hypothetical protein NIES970_07480 [[Synechococcus] sp. NIES-970]|nr:hypothetical protein NIES970_07480 [[Synechococcus] sp. NIES-970]
MSDVAPLNLQDLQVDLRAQLEASYFPTNPVQVRCVFKAGELLVLVQHSAPAAVAQRPIFRLIRDRLQAASFSEQPQVGIYLRVIGASEPYAFYLLDASEMGSPTFPPFPETDLDGADLETEFATDIGFDTLAEPFFAETNGEAETVPEAEPKIQKDFEGLISSDATPDDLAASVQTIGDRPKKKGLVFVGVGILVAIIGAGGYVLSRPCVVGPCQPLIRASQLAAPARELFTAPEVPSGQEIFQAQANLREAIATLEDIPQWSPRAAEIQGQLLDYQSLDASLAALINGLSQAAKAAQLAENQSLGAAQWQEIVQQWQGAIATLEAIPPSDFYHDFAQEKLINYRENLAIAQQRFQAAQAAETITNPPGVGSP